MAVAVILPKLDEAMRAGRIIKWMKKDGDQVEKGDVIFELETEKVTFEIEAEESGILSSVRAKAGAMVPVGTTIAFILQPGEAAPEVPELVVKAERTAPVEVPKITREAEAEIAPTGAEVKASPLAKKIARENNVDLSLVVGTGPGGRITREDVLKAAEEGKVVAAPSAREEPEPVEEEIVPLSSMREIIANRMTESFQVPHFYLAMEVDTQELRKVREQLLPIVEDKVGIRLTLTDLLIKIVAKALEDNPPQLKGDWLCP